MEFSGWAILTLALTASLGGLWLALGHEHSAVARLTGGAQVQEVVVEGRYYPAVIVARLDTPLILRFVRREDQPCSERVIFEGFNVNRYLPAHATTEVELRPAKAGEYMFTCAMGFYRGKLIIR